ncbi:MAG: YggT family protein [Chloroflexi bacterium]|nr:YggT family protein [Chloroflexota bacterium]
MSEFIVFLINALVTFLYVALLGRVIISWLNLSPTNPIANFLYQVTEPILAPLRRVLPSFGMLDLSPMVAIIILALIQNILIRAL